MADEKLPHFLTGGAADGGVRGNQADRLAVPVLGGKALEQRVGVWCIADGKRPDLELLPHAVEDDEPASAVHRNKAGELVGERSLIRVPAGVEQVVAVEEVERRVGHTSHRTPARPYDRWRRAS